MDGARKEEEVSSRARETRREAEDWRERTGQVVLGLSDVHPESLEVESVKLLLGSDQGEDLLLDGSGLELWWAETKGEI